MRSPRGPARRSSAWSRSARRQARQLAALRGFVCERYSPKLQRPSQSPSQFASGRGEGGPWSVHWHAPARLQGPRQFRTRVLRLDQLQLLPVLSGRGRLQLGLVHLRAGLERVGAALIVVVVAVLVDVVAVLVVALVVVVVVALVVALVVARAVVTAVVAGVMVRPVVVAAAARRVRLEVARRVALDLGLIVDGAGELAAAGQRDRQHSALEGLDRAGVLLAVLDPVVVGIAVARVGFRAELAAIVEAVTILVPLGLLDLQRQVVSPLPAVRQLVVVAVTALGRGR